MRLPWYMRQKRAVALVAGLGGLFTVVDSACAQPWEATTAPLEHWSALAASADGTTLIAAGQAYWYFGWRPAPIYASSDGGASWRLTGARSNNWSCVASSADGTRWVAAAGVDPHFGGCGDGLIYVSLDLGTTWIPTSAPSNWWTSVASSADGSILIAVSAFQRDTNGNCLGGGCIYGSLDSGASWSRASAASNDWTCIASSADGTKLVAAAGPAAYVSGPGLIYTSTNSGATWTVSGAPSNNWVSVSSSADGSKLIAAATPESCPCLDGSLYVSTNSGAAWLRATAPSNLWTSVASSSDGSRLLAVATPGGFDNGCCAGEGDGLIYASVDSGVTWMATGAPSAHWAAIAASADGQRAVAADSQHRLLCTFPYSGPWRLANAPAQPYGWGLVASSADGTRLVAGAYYPSGRTCFSTNGGVTWSEPGTPICNQLASLACSEDGTKVVAAASRVNNLLGSIYTSSNSGETWTQTSAPKNAWTCVASSADGLKLVAVAASPNDGDGLIYTSTNAGSIWTPASAPPIGWSSVTCSADGTRLVVAEDVWHLGCIYASSDSGQTWTRSSAPSNVWSCVASSADGAKLVAVGFSYPGDGSIYISRDSGASWIPTSAPGNNWVSVASSTDGSRLVALAGPDYRVGSLQPCIYISTNSGATWERGSPAAANWRAVASSGDGSQVVAVSSDGIYMLRSPAPAPALPLSPRLAIDRLEANLALSWLVPSTRFVLQHNADLGPANWVDVPDGPVLDCTNLHYRITLTPSLNRSFYRLKRN